MRHSARKLYSRNVGRKYLGKWPSGLTFAKDFTLIPNGTYAKATYQYLLNADFALGSPAATNTSTDGNFVINSGYQAITANADVLKYLISGNRTAAQETIVIKFTPTRDFANDATTRYLIDTDTKGRNVYSNSNVSLSNLYPNAADSSGCSSYTSTTLLNGVVYVLVWAIKHSSPYSSQYLNSVSNGGNETSDDFTNNAWGTSMYIGCQDLTTNQGDVIFQSIAFFNRALSTSEVAQATNLM